MTRAQLLESVSNTIKTYRSGELDEPTPDHVDRWLRQFTPENQVPFLREFDHVIKQTFLTEESVAEFIAKLTINEKLTGGQHAGYWAKANVLSIQQDGGSQKAMLKLLEECLAQTMNLKLSACGSPDGDYIYLDDVIFTGNRIGNDLTEWIKNTAPQSAKLHIIVAGWHLFGQYKLEQQLRAAVNDSKKQINITYWSMPRFRFENRLYNEKDAQVLWPSTIPNSQVVQNYLAQPSKYPFKPRTPGGNLGIFSSEAARTVLESEFLIAGATIRSRGQNPAAVNRPLGYGHLGIGFGGLMVTYRNCPNNCPLAMWWGDPTHTSGGLHWYPLLRREGYSSAKNVFNGFF
jgi:hypothetical protein